MFDRYSARLALALPVLFSSSAFAQVHVDWSTPVDGGAMGLDNSVYAAVDGARATYVAGQTQSSPSGAPISFDAFLVKVDAQGNVAWTRSYDEPNGGNQRFTDVAVDSLGRIDVIGRTDPAEHVLLAQYDANGSTLWRTTLAAPPGGSIVANAMALGPNDDIYIVGNQNTPGLLSDIFVARFTTAGEFVWSTTIDPHGQGDDGLGVQLDLIGNVYVCGDVAVLSPWLFNAYVAKISAASGSVIWSAELDTDGAGSHRASALALGSSGEVYTAGVMTSNSNTSFEVVKWSAQGPVEWTRILGGPLPVFVGSGRDIAIDPFGRVIAGGIITNVASNATDMYVEAFDAAGNSQWAAQYDSPQHEQDLLADLEIDPSGGVFVTGTIMGAAIPHSFDVATFRLSSAGVLEWQRIVGSPGGYDDVVRVLRANDESLRVVGSTSAILSPGLSDVIVYRIARDIESFCYGDGSASACPCQFGPPTFGAPGGCVNSTGFAGRLTGEGSASLANDTLVLTGLQMPDSSALYFQGTAQVNGGAGMVFGDGLRCAGGTIVRIAQKTNVAGGSTYPSSISEPSISTIGQVAQPGQRTYQVWYRNAADFCTSATFNLTNALLVTWSL